MNHNTTSKKWILGLTGGICSGKSTATEAFIECGCTVIDADIVAREVVVKGSTGLNKIVAHFGEDVLNEDGTLNRAKLRTIVFSNTEERNFLNNLLHPLIHNLILEKISQAQGTYTIIAAPLLFENHLEKFTNYVLCMDIDEETQIERTILRDNCQREIAEKIVKAQLSREYKTSHSDEVLLSNFATPELLKNKIKELHPKYVKLATDFSNNSNNTKL